MQSTSLNSDSSFSKTGCHSKVWNPCQPYYLRIAKSSCIHTFPKGISTMWNANSLVQELNFERRIHFLSQ